MSRSLNQRNHIMTERFWSRLKEEILWIFLRIIFKNEYFCYFFDKLWFMQLAVVMLPRLFGAWRR